MNQDLQQLPLRDIHLPDPLSWWPPAPGWWGLLVLALLLALLSYLMWRFKQRRRVKQASRKGREQLFSDYHSRADSQLLVHKLSLLLRRIALSHYPRSEVAGLVGEAWLLFLDLGVADTPAQGGFSAGAGTALALAPYKQDVPVDVDALYKLCLQWVRNLPLGGAK